MIPFSPPRIDEKTIKEVTEALLSGWITTGPRTKLFEKKIAEYCNVKNVLATNSWTTGAELLLYWFGIGEGDEVIVPAYTYCATANIVSHRGAKVVMADVTDDFGIDIEKLEKLITPKTKAIIPVDIGGYPTDYKALKDLVNKENIKKLFTPKTENQKKLNRILLLSDAAHSFGAKYNSEAVGAEMDFTVFSFHAVKNLTTAEGGAICINLPEPFDNQEVYKQLNTLSLHGQNKDALSKYKIGNWEYDVIDAGFKCNMTDVLAAIGLVELERYDSETLPKRKQIFEFYQNELSKHSWAIVPKGIDTQKESSYHLFLLRIKNITLEQRNDIIQDIFTNGVSVNVHYKPLPLLSYYKNLGYNIDDYPNAKKLWQTEISLPLFFDLTTEQAQTVVDAVVDAVRKNLK